ncbi:MAG: SHOCT domain-containing protein, partial [Solirubrobacterales bacterium]
TQPVDAGGGGAAGGVPGAAPVLDLRSDPELREKLEKVLGRELTPGTTAQVAENDPALQARIMEVVQEHRAQRAPDTDGAPAGGMDAKLDQLERLNELLASGTLTKEEFEEQKKDILEG